MVDFSSGSESNDPYAGDIDDDRSQSSPDEVCPISPQGDSDKVLLLYKATRFEI
jgi:hypothetical protein